MSAAVVGRPPGARWAPSGRPTTRRMINDAHLSRANEGTFYLGKKGTFSVGVDKPVGVALGPRAQHRRIETRGTGVSVLREVATPYGRHSPLKSGPISRLRA